MEAALAPVIGLLAGTGFFLVMQRDLVRMALGLILISNAANLLIFSAGGLHRGDPPIIPRTAQGLEAGFSDPVPQALILTAIVISFGLLAFLIALVYRAYREFRTIDPDRITRSPENFAGEIE